MIDSWQSKPAPGGSSGGHMVLKTGPLVRGSKRGQGKGIRVGAFVLAAILAGFFCLSAWAPDMDAERGKAGYSSGITSVSSEGYTPGVQEQEMAPAKAAKKRFPWLWVAAGAVAVGVVLYFMVIKKPDYKLSVSLGPRVSGFPGAGMFVYKKGKKVRYWYNPGYGYRDLKATLDGKEIAATGEFAMDRDHVLAVTSEERFYALTVTASAGVSGNPTAGTYSYKEGTSVPYSYVAATSTDYLKVQVDGVDVAAQGTILMDRAHALVAVTKKQFDVRGTWRIVTSGDMLPTQKIIFVGSPATGKVYRSDGVFVLGVYHAAGNDIDFDVFVEDHGPSGGDSISYAGTIRDMNNMGGTFSYYMCDGCGYYDGTWEATRVR
jgi:hypothetical protein